MSKKHTSSEISETECRKCGSIMLRKWHNAIKPKHLRQPFYYDQWFVCPDCHWMLTREEDKVWNKNDGAQTFNELEKMDSLFKEAIEDDIQ